jgi:hypothetical protein
MNTYYYYIRNAEKNIIGTVAIARVNGTVVRGVAITGTGEQPARKIGRAIAKGRLRKALGTKSSCLPIGDKMRERLVSCAPHAKFFKCKAGYNITPTSYESNILEKNAVTA